MSGIPKIVRAMIGTGVAFAAGVGAVSLAAGLILVLLGQGSLDDLRMVGRLAVVAFIVGVAFAGLLAVTARSRRLARISVARFAALGAGAGLLYFVFIAINAAGRWSLADAIGNFVILTLLGSGAAIGTLLVARRGRSALGAAADPHAVGEGSSIVDGLAAREARTKSEVG